MLRLRWTARPQGFHSRQLPFHQAPWPETSGLGLCPNGVDCTLSAMAATRGNRAALFTGVVVRLAMAGGSFSARSRRRGAWYLWRLESPDEVVRCHAAEMLGNLRSVRAV